MNKFEQKKQQQYQERRNRFLNAGVPADKVDQVIAQEDYDNLSVDKKVKRIEMVFQGFAQQIGQDLQALRFNEGMIADAMDANLRTIAKCFELLGVTKEKQFELLKESEAEILAERKAGVDKQEQAQVEQAVRADPSMTGGVGPVFVPEEATTFGG